MSNHKLNKKDEHVLLPGFLFTSKDPVGEGVSLPESELDMRSNSSLLRGVSLFSVESPSRFLRVNL